MAATPHLGTANDLPSAAAFRVRAACGHQKDFGSALGTWHKTRLAYELSLALLLLDVARQVHEEGDRQQQRLNDVGDVEVSAGIDLCPLGVVVVEPRRKPAPTLRLYKFLLIDG